MKKEIITEKVIKAKPHEIMSVLINTKRYPDWNPFIAEVIGDLKKDKRIRITITPPNSSRMTFFPEILSVTDDEIRWRGKFLIKGLFDGEHYFRLIRINESETKLIHGEIFSGILVKFLPKVFVNTETGFQQMNEALGREVSRIFSDN